MSSRRRSVAGSHAESLVDPNALAAAKRASVAQLLFRTARLLNVHALSTLRASTGLEVRPAHTALFPHIDLEGTRQTVLAERLGVSRQAVHKLVNELIDMEILELSPDPTDARAQRVIFSRRKGHTLLDGVAQLMAVETELRELLGQRRYAALRTALLHVEGWLDSKATAGDH